jgi:hypothetical protein
VFDKIEVEAELSELSEVEYFNLNTSCMQMQVGTE